jgi:hypothetical protein
MSELLYGRVVTVNVENTELKGFDCDFEVARTLEPTPNKAKVKLFNLPVELQAAAQKADGRILIHAGYIKTAAQIFLGDIRYSSTVIAGPDIVTTIEAGDGEKAYRDAVISLTWAKGKPITKIVEEIIDTFEGVQPGDFARTFKAKVKEQFPHGGALSGNSARVLDELVRGYGYRFSIQDGQFQFVDATGANQKTAVVLTPSTGLVGTIEIGEKDKKTGKSKVKIKSLLQPKIIPGSVIDVDDGATKGRFVAKSVTHEGSNYGLSFYTNIESETK